MIMLFFLLTKANAIDYKPAADNIVHAIYYQSNLERYVDSQEQSLEKQYVPNSVKKPGAVVFFIYEAVSKHLIGWTWKF
jgi:hypothetical protein